MNWTCCFLFTILAGFPRATTIGCSLMTNLFTRRQDLVKVVLCTKFDLHVINKYWLTSALVQLRINFTCILKVFQIALVASRLGQFCENFENTCEINP